MKIYVAGPMTGLPQKNYPAFNDAASKLGARGYEPLNPVDVDKNLPGTPVEYDWYLRATMRMLTEADAVALLPGWRESTGANVEVQFAIACGMEVRDLDYWLRDAWMESKA